MSHSDCKYERKLSCHSVSGSVCSPLPNCSVRLDCDSESLPGIVTFTLIGLGQPRAALFPMLKVRNTMFENCNFQSMPTLFYKNDTVLKINNNNNNDNTHSDHHHERNYCRTEL